MGRVVRLLDDEESLCLLEPVVILEVILRVSESRSFSLDDRGLTRASLPYRSCSTPAMGIMQPFLKSIVNAGVINDYLTLM